MDFAGRGDLVDTADQHAEQLRSLLGGSSATATPVRPRESTTVVGGGASTSSISTRGTTAPVDTGPPLTTTPIQRLTGGDPASFCAALPDARRTIYAWALGASTEPGGEAGQHDLAFGPALARRLPAFVAVAPTELAARAQPVLDRPGPQSSPSNRSEWTRPRSTGWPTRPRGIQRRGRLDTTAAEQEVVAAAAEAVGGDRFVSGAAALASGQPPDPGTLRPGRRARGGRRARRLRLPVRAGHHPGLLEARRRAG